MEVATTVLHEGVWLAVAVAHLTGLELAAARAAHEVDSPGKPAAVVALPGVGVRPRRRMPRSHRPPRGKANRLCHQ